MQKLMEITSKQGPTAEAMRLLPAGVHVLHVRGAGAKTAGPLIVRAMPETHFVCYPGRPRFPELGNFTWDWLRQNVLSSVNTIAGASQGIDREIDGWTSSGREFIAYAGLPHDKDLTGARALDFWLKNPGFQGPRHSGLIADEFSGRQNPLYPAWIEGIRMLGQKMKGSGKAFYEHTGGPGTHSRPENQELARTVIDSGF